MRAVSWKKRQASHIDSCIPRVTACSHQQTVTGCGTSYSDSNEDLNSQQNSQLLLQEKYITDPSICVLQLPNSLHVLLQLLILQLRKTEQKGKKKQHQECSVTGKQCQAGIQVICMHELSHLSMRAHCCLLTRLSMKRNHVTEPLASFKPHWREDLLKSWSNLQSYMNWFRINTERERGAYVWCEWRIYHLKQKKRKLQWHT